MGVIVSLKEIVDAMDLPNEEWASYLNPTTHEIVTVTGENPHRSQRESSRRWPVERNLRKSRSKTTDGAWPLAVRQPTILERDIEPLVVLGKVVDENSVHFT